MQPTAGGPRRQPRAPFPIGTFSEALDFLTRYGSRDGRKRAPLKTRTGKDIRVGRRPPGSIHSRFAISASTLFRKSRPLLEAVTRRRVQQTANVNIRVQLPRDRACRIARCNADRGGPLRQRKMGLPWPWKLPTWLLMLLRADAARRAFSSEARRDRLIGIDRSQGMDTSNARGSDAGPPPQAHSHHVLVAASCHAGVRQACFTARGESGHDDALEVAVDLKVP